MVVHLEYETPIVRAYREVFDQLAHFAGDLFSNDMLKKALDHGGVFGKNLRVLRVVELVMRFVDVERERRRVFGIFSKNILSGSSKLVS